MLGHSTLEAEIRVTRILKALGVFVGAVGVVAFLFVSMLLLAFAPEATPQSDVQHVRPVVPAPKPCAKWSADRFNKLLAKRKELTGKGFNKVKRPVCVRPKVRRIQAQVNRLKRRLATDARIAIPKAFSDAGIGWRSAEALRVAWCESRYNRFARNSGGYSGLFQLSYAHQARMRGDWFNAYDNAYHAAITVRADGSWSQWVCKP